VPSSTATPDIEIIHTNDGAGSGSTSSGHGSGANVPPRPDGGDPDRFPGRAPVPQRTYVTGMIVGLGGILMFFMALVSAYIVHKGMPGSDWRILEVPRILWLNTAILIASSFTLAHARSRFRAADEEGFRHWWGVTTILGVFFLVGQIIAWRQLVASGVGLSTNPSSSFFYLFTAAHGLHVLGGVLALAVVLFRPANRPMRRISRGTASEVVSMYWHFMDGLWAFLFALLVLGR
jgi:cytochrome c oxidase subunit III